MDIKSSENLNYDNAVQILNSFTPQGASPKFSLRIGSWDDKIGIGCYYMEDAENARISTILIENSGDVAYNPINIPSNDESIINFTKGDYIQLFLNKPVESNIFEKFDVNTSSMILYSFLAGDNMIIIHPNHEYRLEFIKSMMEFVPNVFYRYNRITSGCSELDGNENIIGVEELPVKYRSHKKLYMPLDTIFVDLLEFKVVGEGLKNNQFTKNIVEEFIVNKKNASKRISNYFKDISKEIFSENDKYGDNSKLLTDKIRTKLGLNVESDENWILSF